MQIDAILRELPFSWCRIPGSLGGYTKVERLEIPGPVGQLEALLEWDPDRQARLAAVVCHPHPQHGGTLHNKVVYRAAKAAIQLGIATLRFNFRGVGRSQGEFAGGRGERDDLRAALDHLETRYPGTHTCVMGFSFGAWVGLEVGSGDSRASALVGIGVPTGSSDLGFLHSAPKPKLILQGTQDAFGPRAEVEELFASLTEPKQLRWVEDADHFFTGKLDEVQSAVGSFLEETFPELLPGAGKP